MHINQNVAEHYVDILYEKGKQGLYYHCMATGIMRSMSTKNPDAEMLNISDGFLDLFRKKDNPDYLVIHNVLRKAAHNLYRQFLKVDENKTINKRFLNVVK